MNEPRFIKVYDSEAEYRADKESWNYSRIKDGLKHPLSYRKKHILGDNSDDPDNEGLNDGKLLDIRLLGTEEDFENQYFLSSLQTLPTEKRKLFADTLMQITLEQTKDNVFEGNFIDCCQRAWDSIGGVGNSKFSTFMEKFAGSDIDQYYEQCRKSTGRTVISYNQLEKIDFACNSLKTEESTGEFFQGDGINQLPIQYEYNGKLYRCMFDRMKIDKENKTLEFADVKNCFEPHEFVRQYLKMSYYIQQGVYSKGAIAYRDALFPEFEILSFSFYVADINGYHKPLKWTINFSFEDPWSGFTINNRYYKGIWQIIEDIEWHIENDEWRIKREHHEKNGQLTFTI